MPTNYVVMKGNRYIADTMVQHNQTEGGAVSACQTIVPGIVESSPPPHGFIHYFSDASFNFAGVVAVEVVTP